MVGRPRSIDRDKVLDAAEALVTEKGAAELSFESVARAAGITKSGVQYCFGTKENLIRSMIERWGASFETEVMERAGPDRSPFVVEFHRVEIAGEPVALEHDGLAWVRPEELGGLDLAPSDRAFSVHLLR